MLTFRPLPLIAWVCLLIFAPPCFAQESMPAPLRLDSAVELSLQNYPAIRAAKAQAAAATNGEEVARAGYLPRVELDWQQTRGTRNNVFGQFFPQAGVPPISGPVLGTVSFTDSAWGSGGGLLVAWEPFDFGLRKANVELANRVTAEAQARVAVTQLDVAMSAADAFLRVVAADQAVRAAQANVERMETFSKAVHALVDSQLRPGADASRTDAELAAARNVLLQAKQQAAAARVALADAVGLAGQSPAVEVGPLLELPPAPIPATAAGAAAHPFIQLQKASLDIILARQKVLARSFFPRFNWQTAVFGRVELGSDILTGYGLINERRTVYIPVTKRAEASTLDVVNRVKAEVPNFQKLIPEDIKVSFEFDQSQYVRNAVRGLALEGALGAILTGLMVLLFLRDARSALIVIITIPVALLAALVGLWLTGETVNVMTLGGLALAIGILVDESTVAIENIHTHIARGEPKANAVLMATRETITPRLLAMLAILAVFVPSFLMVGVSRSLFVPLSLAVGFAMLASYFLSNTLVPILSVWWLQSHANADHEEAGKMKQRFSQSLATAMRARRLVLVCYVLIAFAAVFFIGRRLGTDIFPNVDTGSFSLRLRAPTGTRVERTEVIALNVLKTIRAEAHNNVEITIGYVGTQPASYPVNTIHQWTSGPHEAILLVKLKSGSGIHLSEFKERLRAKLQQVAPGTSFSFEAGDIITQVMNFGAPTPIEVALSGPNLTANRGFTEKVLAEMKKIPSLRDLQFAQPLDYPTVNINIDRERAVIGGLTASTLAVLFVLPLLFAVTQRKAKTDAVSLHPEDFITEESAVAQ